MASLFLAYGLVLAAFAAMLFWLILRAYRSKTSESFDSASISGLFDDEENVVDLSAYRRADIGALRLLQEYSYIETSNLSEKDKLREILLWNQKLESFEKDNRKIIQSKGFLRPVQAKTKLSSVTPLSKI
ncbi:hypothetical protein [Kangiella spongicola]|jgi:hypothetical protein|uniref:Uncharacterized protein n=1 Tax=Kangiella spongicola TaxID=796379 RepID=A0A318D773_9GAMM|nr:hypothetical protein [Kangiella spongicola]PXF63054.1 hypothetical protein DL796_06270 [Kangiella spongicola]